MNPLTPLELYTTRVRSEWIDYNQHMMDGYYGVAFGHAIDAFLDFVGLDATYRAATHCTVFTAEAHAVFVREVKADSALRIRASLLAHDAKRIHLFQEMFHGDEGYLAATQEAMLLHVDQAQKRVAPIPAPILARLESIWRAHVALPRPAQVGRRVSMTKQP